MTAQKRVEDGLYWDRARSLVEGCTPASEGCRNCWAANLAWNRRNRPNPKIAAANQGLTECAVPLKNVRDRSFATPPQFNGVVRVREDLLDLPLKTKRPAVFSIWTDLFHESVPEDFIVKAFQVMRDCPQHTFLVLTKRAELMHKRIMLEWSAALAKSVLGENVWLGVMAENQEMADRRIPWLIWTYAARRFVSCEPLLERINLRLGERDYLRPDWIICGPETGSFRRPFEVAWAQSLLDECRESGYLPATLFFDKSAVPLRRDLPWTVKP